MVFLYGGLRLEPVPPRVEGQLLIIPRADAPIRQDRSVLVVQ